MKPTSEQPERKNDPSLYRKLSEPFDSSDEMIGAMQAFWDEVKDLREKHRIADVYVTMRASWGEEEIPYVIGIGAGNSDNEVPMLSVALAGAQRDRDDNLTRLLRQIKRRG